MRGPLLLAIALVCLGFGLGCLWPYAVVGDVAYQLKSVQQFATGQVGLFNAVTVPDPLDLAGDRVLWTVWWPPGMAVIFYPLVALGLPLGEAARWTAFGLVVAGVSGWLWVAQLIPVSSRTLWALAVLLPGLSAEPMTYLYHGDILPWAVLPWLLGWLLRGGGWALPFFLGSVYWLKYSAFTVVVGLMVYWGWQRVRARTWGVLLLGLVLFSLPGLGLTGLNRSLAQVDTALTQYVAAPSTPQPTVIELGLGALGLPGRALFGMEELLWAGVKRLDLNYSAQILLFAGLGLPGTLILVSSLGLIHRRYGLKSVGLIALTTLLPTILLTGLSALGGYNFVLQARYLEPGFMLWAILWLDAIASANLWFLGGCLVVLPTLYGVISPWRQAVQRVTVTTATQLYQPAFPPEMVAQLQALIQSPRDVVILDFITPATTYGPWLELSARTLPLDRVFPGPLAQLHHQPLYSAVPLRVIVVMTEDEERVILARYKQRIPQIKRWSRVQNKLVFWYGQIL